MGVIYTLLFTFLLSSVIAIVYIITTYKSDRSKYFVQSLILGSIAASIVVQAIGDSVAIGLGVLGALAIIRFRTNFRNPRNIIFLFSALATGIACGVYGYVIAVVGTAGFSMAAMILQWSSFTGIHETTYLLRITFDLNVELPTELGNFLNKKGIHSSLRLNRVNAENGQSIEFKVWIKRSIPISGLLDEIKGNFNIKTIRIAAEEMNENFD